MKLIEDPIGLEVFRNEVAAVAEEMGITMQRTARSVAAREGGDFSTAIVDSDGGLVAQGMANGVHIGYVSSVMPRILEKFGGRFEEGDVIICNDPYVGLSHLPDIVAIEPVFVDGSLIGFATVVCHHSDVGGRAAGGMAAESSELFEEGIRFPRVKMYCAGVPNEAVMDILAANTRAPEDLMGDLDAQVAACHRGAAGLRALVTSYERARFQQYVEWSNEYSERLMRGRLAELKDGVYSYCEEFEDDGCGGEGLHIQVAVTIDGDGATVDFTGTDPQVPSAINCPLGITRAVVYAAFRSIIGSGVPPNAGMTAPIEVVAPEGTIVNPRFPGAVGARGMLLWRLIDVVLGALADAAPGRVSAGGEGGLHTMLFSPRRDKGRERGMLFDLFCSGWGARLGADGIDGVTPIIAGGAIRTTPAEIIEREFPVVIEGFGFLPDTGGAGEFRGSLSLVRSWRFLEPGHVQIRSNRVKSVPYGIAGGRSGSAYSVKLLRNGVWTSLPPRMVTEVDVEAGDLLVNVQPGGGGYGEPLDRDVERVLLDVRDGKLSLAEAASAYGVVIDEDLGELDKAATNACRDERRTSAGGRADHGDASWNT